MIDKKLISESEGLEFPSPMEDVMTHDLGLFKYVKLTDELNLKYLKIDKDKISLVEQKEEGAALDFLSNNLFEYNYWDKKGTVVFYCYGSQRKSSIAFEGGYYLGRLCIAIKIFTKKKARLIYHFSYDKTTLPVKFYRPYDFIMDDSDIGYRSEDVSYLKTSSDIDELNRIYKSLVTLPIDNGFNYNRILNAVVNTDRAQNENWINLKITLFFIALESLFSDSDKTELIYKISLRTASLLHNNDKSKKVDVFRFLKVGYDMRSKFLHGSKVDHFDIGKNLKVRTSHIVCGLIFQKS